MAYERMRKSIRVSYRISPRQPLPGLAGWPMRYARCHGVVTIGTAPPETASLAHAGLAASFVAGAASDGRRTAGRRAAARSDSRRTAWHRSAAPAADRPRALGWR